jgi:hypothetical protein
MAIIAAHGSCDCAQDDMTLVTVHGRHKRRIGGKRRAQSRDG